MASSLFFLTSLVVVSFQGYITVYALFSPALFFKIYGLEEQAILDLFAANETFFRILPLGYTLPVLLMAIVAMVWTFQHKSGGKVILTLLSIVWLIIGLVAFASDASGSFITMEGGKGAALLGVLIIATILNRKKKYLFDVKK